MNQPQQPSYWPKIQALKPKLCPHIEINPQCYREERWFVLRDTVTGRHLRFNAMSYEIIGRFDGQRSLADIFAQISLAHGEACPSQEQMIHLVSQLMSIDALNTGIPIDVETRLKSDSKARKEHWQQRLMNPLALRFALFDPNLFLNRSLAWFKPLLSPTGIIIWCLVIAFAMLLAVGNSSKLAVAISESFIAAENLLLLWLLYPIIKACHEFAHGYMVKLWGGEVHEMGITFLVFIPVPYIDASAAWTFRERKKRVLVGAAGIMTELFLAALGLFVWLIVEPGMVSQAALFVFITGSISTVLFNANPLLRFDGYFILQDVIEIPNLASRSSRYYLYLLQRYLFGLSELASPVTARGEPAWFVIYGFAAFAYRLFLLAIIVLFLMEDYLLFGIVIGCWAITLQIILPLWRGFNFLLSSEKLIHHRQRAAITTTSLCLLVIGSLFFIPAPLTTFAQGVVWVPEQAQVYAETDGFLAELFVPSGTQVKSGTQLVKMHSPELEKKITVLEAERSILNIKITEALLNNPVLREILAEELRAINAELQQRYQQRSGLTISTHLAGVFVSPDEHQLGQRYFKQGDLLGYVVSPERLIIRTVVTQADIALVREHDNNIQIRLAERLNQVIDAKVIRMTPAGSKELPSLALSVEGGGKVVVERGDDGEINAKEAMFQIDLSLPKGLAVTGLGERAYVRFDHGSEPLALQWLRRGRQLLLSRLSF